VRFDRAVGRTAARAMFSVSIGTSLFTYFDFADDVAFLAKLNNILQSALIIFWEESSELGLHVNWQKTKVQSLSDFDVRPMNFSTDGEAVEFVESFLYLGILTHKSDYYILGILKRLGLARSAFGCLRTNIWDLRLVLSTKVCLFRTYVLPVLYMGRRYGLSPRRTNFSWTHLVQSVCV